MDEDCAEFLSKLTLIIILCVVFLSVICLGLGTWDCNAKTKNMEYPHKYFLIGECMIDKGDNEWIPYESYSIIP